MYFLEMDEEDGMGWWDERYSNNWPSSHTLWRWKKRMRWDEMMGDIQTIDQVHLRAGDGWRGSDEMIRWEVFNQLTKFTYSLEMDEEDGMGWSDERYLNNWLSSCTIWRQVKGTGWDDQKRDIQTIEQVHILSGDGWRGWDGTIRWEMFKQLAKFIYKLEMDEEDGMGWSHERYSNNWPSSHTLWRQMKRTEWDDQMWDIQTIDQVHILPGDRWGAWNGMIRWEIFKQLTKFTYRLEMDEEDGMGWSHERYSNNWPSSLTSWRQMKGMGSDDQMRGIQSIKQVHLLSGDGWRGWYGMVRQEIFKQLTKFMYHLVMGKEDGMGRSEDGYLNNWPSSHTLWRWMKRRGSDDQMRDIQTIGQVHLQAGDRRRRWDVMIRWEVFNINYPSTLTLWRWMEWTG